MAIVMVFSILPTFVFAETGDTFTVEAMSGNMDKPVPVTYRVLTEDASGGMVAVAGQGSNPAIPTDTTSLVLPNTVTNNGKIYTVTEIGESDFEGCTSLNWINLPKSLTKIGVSAFEGAGLGGIDIPTSVTYIADNAFRDCSDLRFVASVSKTPAQLGNDAFLNCASDLEIRIPFGTISAYVAKGWPQDYLIEIYYFQGQIIDTYSNPISGATLSIYDKNGNFKGSFTTDEKGLFNNTNYFEYGIEYTVKIEKQGYMTMSRNFNVNYQQGIGMYTILLAESSSGFSSDTVENAPITYQILTKDETSKTGTARVVYGPGSLWNESITIPDTVTHDGITYTVTEIGDYAFCRHYNTTSISLPSGLETVNLNAFIKCTKIDIISNNQIPPKCVIESAFLVGLQPTVYIPVGTKQAYIDAGWSEDIVTFKEVNFSSLSGKVVDENGIADAKVTIYNDSGYQESVYTNSDGRYSFNNYLLGNSFINSYVANGCNKIKVEKVGYKESVVDLGLFEGDMTNVEITLSPSPVTPTPTDNPVTPTNNSNETNTTQTSINNTHQTGENSGTIIYIAFGCILFAILASVCVVVVKRRKNKI